MWFSGVMRGCALECLGRRHTKLQSAALRVALTPNPMRRIEFDGGGREG